MSILIWLTIGFIVSLISIYFAPRSSSVLGTLLLGGLGAFLGAVLGSVVFNLDQVGLSFPTIIMALISAVVLLLIQRSIIKV